MTFPTILLLVTNRMYTADLVKVVREPQNSQPLRSKSILVLFVIRLLCMYVITVVLFC